MYRVLLVALITCSVVAGVSAGRVAAQDATPASDMSPDPEQCTLTPRTLEEVQAIHGDPHPAGAGEATAAALDASPVMVELPEGEPADEATVEGVLATVVQLFACHNAGHYLAGFAAVSDNFLESQVGVALFDEDFVAAMSGEPVALEEEHQTHLLDIRNVVVLEDGRVAALVDYFAPTPQVEGIDGFETDLFIFINVDGTWLLDESIENLERQHGPEGMATPVS
jgi:hypothetical protein